MNERLVPIAEFAEPAGADEAWAMLDDEGIPASVVTDRAFLGAPDVTRLYVEASNVARAQSIVQDLVD